MTGVNMKSINHGIVSARAQGLIDFAFDYAERKHFGQVRKYTGEAYIHHPVRVARLVAAVTTDVEMISAAFLHDVIEDCGVTREDLIAAGFGHTIANMVQDLSDRYTSEAYPNTNRRKRKLAEAGRLGQCDARVQTVKVADLISNTSSIVQHDPGFAKTYLREKFNALACLTKADRDLHMVARAMLPASMFTSTG